MCIARKKAFPPGKAFCVDSLLRKNPGELLALGALPVDQVAQRCAAAR
jgi:hypothetical protein